MDYKLLVILMLITVMVALVYYQQNKEHNEDTTEIVSAKELNETMTEIEGSWLGGTIVVVRDIQNPRGLNICYHNKDHHTTIPCNLVQSDGQTAKVMFVNNVGLPYISKDCISLTYDRINDVLVYKGRSLKHSLFDESRFEYNPSEIFVVVCRNKIQVVHGWNTLDKNCLRVNGHLIRNVSGKHENGYLKFLDSVFPGSKNEESTQHIEVIRGVRPGEEVKSIIDCDTNLMDSFVYFENRANNVTDLVHKCEGSWLGGSFHVKQINDNSFEFCNLEGDVCSYARAKGNRFVLNPTNDLLREESKDNRLCNSLYYDAKNDIFVWYGDPCLKNYSDLDNKINSEIYMVIMRDKLIFYIGNVKAVESASPYQELNNEIYNPMNVLVRPIMNAI